MWPLVLPSFGIAVRSASVRPKTAGQTLAARIMLRSKPPALFEAYPARLVQDPFGRVKRPASASLAQDVPAPARIADFFRCFLPVIAFDAGFVAQVS